MASAIYDTISVEVSGKTPDHNYLLRTSGTTIRFQGFLILYEETKGIEARNNNDAADSNVPVDLIEGLALLLINLLPEQHFTQPPPRYSEASLVRTLEEFGIGRPSTYAPTLATIQNRGYVEKDGRRLCPTETGFLVNDLLVEHFPEILNVGFDLVRK